MKTGGKIQTTYKEVMELNLELGMFLLVVIVRTLSLTRTTLITLLRFLLLFLIVNNTIHGRG